MRRYELMLVLKPDAPDERAAAVIDRTTRYVVAEGGQIIKVAPWGRRRLAYPIERYREGSYHIVVFESPAEAIAELERSLQITEDVLRYLVTRAVKPVKARRDAAAGGDAEDADVDDRPRRRPRARGGRGRRADRASRSTSPRARPHPRPSTDQGASHGVREGHDHRQPRARSRDALHAQRPARDGVQRGGQPADQDAATGEWARTDRLVPRHRLGRPRRAHRRAVPQGQQVFVEGRFRTREFEGKDGQKRISLEITADNVISLDARVRDEEGSFGAPAGGFGGAGGGGGGGGGEPVRPTRAPQPTPDDLDDLPF